MCASANEVQILDFVELVLWSAPQHLVETVSEVEHGAAVTVIAPIFGCDDHFCDDVVSQSGEPEFLFNLVEDAFFVGFLMLFPVDVLMNVRNGDEGVDG